jgi:hypothetical protein
MPFDVSGSTPSNPLQRSSARPRPSGGMPRLNVLPG